MTLKELVVKWNNSWKYDYWFRQKYGISFNSEEHRESNQIDIVFEYMENYLSNQALERYKDNEVKKEELKKNGQWIRESEGNKEKIEKAFDKIDLKDF